MTATDESQVGRPEGLCYDRKALRTASVDALNLRKPIALRPWRAEMQGSLRVERF
jgi:hypothetical protein